MSTPEKLNLETRKRGADPTMPRLLGDRLCLDFANTIESPLGEPEEFLHEYTDLVRWGRHTDYLDQLEAEELLTRAKARPNDARDVFTRAVGLRSAITRVFRAIAAESRPAVTDLDLIHAEYLRALEHARLERSDDHFHWKWRDDESLDRPLWSVARSAIEVLTRDDLRRVKECPGADDCGWLFYDTSKNMSRRWCSMEGCGSRVKMRNQYARQKAKSRA